MLIRRAELDRIVAGEIDLAFRRQKRPTVKAGGTLTTAVGVLAIAAVDRIEPEDVTDVDARRAGFTSASEVLEMTEGRDGDLYRVRLGYSGEDPRVRLREQTELSDAERTEIRARLERYDRASRRGPWTAKTLELIRDHPATLAATLAEKAGWDKAWFKPNVRKLKALGLTESLKTGYRLSPRGRAFMNVELSDARPRT